MVNEGDEKERLENDKDLDGSEIALRRAAQRARELAKEKGSYIVIFRDGEILEVKVDDVA